MADDDARLAVVIEARFDKLQNQLNGINRSIHGSMQKAQKDIDDTDKKWERMFLGEGPGKALDSVFSRARLGAVEEGSAKIGVFGSAIEKLGPVGIAAAVGVAAVTAAFEQAHKAAEFADEIDDTSARLHISTDALQQYRYAILAAGGQVSGADQALEAFSENLGKAQEGLVKGQRAFIALGFSKEQIHDFKDADEALRAVTERINQLGSNQEKDAIIDQLGLKGLKPLIESGTVAMNGFLQEAKDAGAVLDADLIHKGAEANKQFELLSRVIDVQLKSAFIDLAPVLTGLLTFAAQLAKDIARVVDMLRSVENRSISTLRDEAASKRKFADATDPIATSKVAIDAVTSGRSMDEVRASYRARADYLDWQADKKEIALQAPPESGPTGNRHLSIPAKSTKDKAGPPDQSDQQLDGALKAELSAHAALLQVLLDQAAAYSDQEAQIREIAAIRSREIDAEREQADDRIKKQKNFSAEAQRQADAMAGLSEADLQAKAAAAKTVTERQAVALALNAQAAEAKKQALNLQTDRKVAEAANAQDEDWYRSVSDIRASYSEIASISSSQAKTAADRREIELRNFDLNTKADRQILEAKDAYLVSIKKMTQSEADARLATFDDLSTARRGQIIDNTKGPVDQGRDEARGEADSIVSGIVKQDDQAGRYAEMYDQIDRLRQKDVISEQEAERAKGLVSARYTQERLSTASQFFGNLASLSQSSNKKLAAIGKAAAIAQATIDGIAAVQVALKSYPPPINFAMAAAVGVVAAVNVAKIAGVGGFEKGGYTGNGGRSEVAGAVHGQEYVWDADTTARNRPLLDLMQHGGTFRMPPAPSRQPMTMRHDVKIAVDLTGAVGDQAIMQRFTAAMEAASQHTYERTMAAVPARMRAYQDQEA